MNDEALVHLFSEDATTNMPGPTIQTRRLAFAAGGKKILSAIDLAFEAGQITTIIGPSGSGKSTLLKCVTTALAPTEGEVLVDDQDLKKDLATFRGRLGYVPQDDIIHRELRVEQAFQFAARLRLGSEYSREEIARRVEKTARELGLLECRFRRVRSLSGGQRKRVNVGVELLAEPDILVLDEPASGLDPATEEDLLHILRRLADQERTIVLTTHSMEYLSLVDRIVILMEGSVIFAGTLNELLAYFDIPHVADVFKTIRGRNALHWKNKYRASPLAGRAARVSKESGGPPSGLQASTSIAARSHDLPWL